MATQLDFQASPPGMQESLPAAKKRKRGGNNHVDSGSNPNKRSNGGSLNDVNGSMPIDSQLQDNSYPEAPAPSSAFPPHPSHHPHHHQHGSSHDMTPAAMAQALQGAHDSHMQSPYPGGIDQTGGFEMGSPSQGAPQPYGMQPFTSAHPGAPTTPTGVHGVGTPGDGTTQQLQQGGSPGDDDGLGGSGNKPAVGSDEWHKVRRDNHKEVERRRRETINEGINELAKIVPGNEKNKGSILARTVTYIRELQANNEAHSGQHSLERQLLEQAVDELSRNNDKLKEANRALEGELEALRGTHLRLMARVREIGASVDDEELVVVVGKTEQ